MKLIWVSDVHLNFVKDKSDFYRYINEAKGDAVVISGDIGESHNTVGILEELQKGVGIPVYFVLGNHDFYGSDVVSVKRSVKHLRYLSNKSYVPLNNATALLGVDGWGDCRNGDYNKAPFVMNDWIHIKDLRKGYGQGMKALKDELQTLADKDARSLKRKVNKAIKDGFTKIIIVTHVPAFGEAALHAGRKSTDGGIAFYSSKILGETILPIAKKNPEIDFLWLSGHTHSRAIYKPCDNMIVKVAKAEYFYPQIEEVITL